MQRWLIGLALAAIGCGGDDVAVAPSATTVAGVFELDGSWDTPETFYDAPFPSDLRLDTEGHPIFTGFVNRDDNPLVAGALELAVQHPKWPMVPVAHFRFGGALAPLDVTAIQPASLEAPVLLVDIDPSSPDRGTLIPTIATVPPPDAYVPEHLLAVAAQPGFVLQPERTYAFVVTDALDAADGSAVQVAPGIAALRDGTASGAQAAAASALYEPLWATLDELGMPRERVVHATVFTTGDIVQETADLTDRMRNAYDVTIDGLVVDPDDGNHERFCELLGTVTFPMFQRGQAPYDTEGMFEIGADGLPIQQGTQDAPVVIALPKGEMPADGFPLVMYYHGSGGLSSQVVDRGKVLVPGGPTTKGEGPAYVLAAHGFATVGSAHPVNPERFPGASSIAYLNLDNARMFRDTFRQGIFEQRVYLDALLDLEIDPASIAACDGMTLPAGATSFHFDPEPILATGQSMGGMYTNLVGAVDPRIEAVVPTGAGGFWSYFILETTLVGGRTLIPIVVGTDPALTHLHPALSLLELAWEAAEPMVYMPRLAQRPLEGHPARPAYEPVGLGDSYFPSQLYDVIALAYGHEQAGDEVWPTMQPYLASKELDGFLSYPVEDNLTSADGTPYTGVVVQYAGDGIYDPHAIYAQLDEVKHQYGCFFETFFQTGTATVVAPGPVGSACQ